MSTGYGRGSGFLPQPRPRKHDHSDKRHKSASDPDARVAATYAECLKIVRTAPSIEEAARKIEEAMNA